MKKIFLLLLLSGVPLAAGIPFYVKQERVQLPGRSIEVGVQGNTEGLVLTVYKIGTPELFLAQQNDIHQLRIEDTPLRADLNRAIQISQAAEKPQVHGDVAEGRVDFEYIKSLAAKIRPAEEASFDGYSPVSLKVDKPGLYLIEAVRENYVTYSLALCSDLALLVRRSTDRVLVYAVDRNSGKPRANADVWIYRGGKVLAQGKSDGQGIFVAAIAYTPHLFVMARDGENFTADDPAFFPALVDSYRAYLFTERPLYLPGEKVFFKGIVRANIAGEYATPKDATEVSYRALDARKNEIASGKAGLNEEAAFAGEFKLPKSFALGNCTLEVTCGSRRFQTEFRAEEFEKPKFIVAVKPDVTAMVMGNKAHYSVSGRYYSGGKVEEGSVKYQLYRSRFHQPLFKDAGLAGFYSKGEYRSFKAELLDSGEAKIVDSECRLSFDTARSDFSYHLRLQVFVIDPSGNSAGSSGSIAVAPADTRMDLTTNKELYSIEEQIEIAVKAVDLAEKPVSADFRLELVRKGREYPKGGHAGLPGEIPQVQGSAVAPEKFYTTSGKTGANGLAVVEVPAIRAGEIDVALYAQDEKGNAIHVVKTVWVESGKEPILYSGRSIRLVADKKAYQRGDVAEVLVILPMADVTPLITIENVSVMEYRVEHFPNNAGVIRIAVADAMTPNVYVKVGAVYKNGYVEAEKMLVVPPVEKMIRLAVTPDKSGYGPGEEARFDIFATDYYGNPVSTDLALAVVDASIYALAPDGNAPLLNFFYPLRRPNVAAASSIVQLSYDYARETGRIPITKKTETPDKPKALSRDGDSDDMEAGGDDSEELLDFPGPRVDLAREVRPEVASPPSPPSPDPEKKQDTAQSEDQISERELFETTAAWFAFVRTGPDGKGEVKLRWPDNLTDWQVTARAIDERTHIGELVAEVSTRKPVMAAVTYPPFLVEGDNLNLQIAARNATEIKRKMKLTAKATGGVALDKKASLTKEVAAGKWLRFAATLKATSPGDAILSVSVSADEHADAEKRTFPVLAHGVRQSKGVSGVLRDKITTIPMAFEALPGAKDVVLTVRVTPGYVAAIQESLGMLMEYPYGCTEQTMSRFMPNLAATEVLKKLELNSPLPPQELKRYVDAGVARLHQLQNQDGGWGWWRNDSLPMMSAYVASGLGRAHALGYEVSGDVRARAAGFLAAKLESTATTYAEKAYILYALSLNDALPDSGIDKVFDDEERLKADPYTLSLLALALAQTGRAPEAKVLVKELAGHAQMAGDAGVYWGNATACRWDEDAAETTAMALRAFIKIAPEHELIPPALDWLMSQRKGRGWRSTKDTAEAVLTLCTYLSLRRQARGEGETVEVRVGESAQKIQVSDTTETAVFSGDALSGKVVISCDNPGQLFYSAYLEYFTAEAPIRPAAAGISIERSYHLAVPSAGTIVHRELPEQLAPGQTVMVTLTVTVPRELDFVMVEDHIPATAQAVRDDRDIEVPGATWDHREFHLEKTVFFFTRLPPGNHTVHYFLRTVHTGLFHALPASASLMYYPEIRGNSAEAMFAVK